jgi:hypothetical protein
VIRWPGRDVDLVAIQAEQGYWAWDFDSYVRAPSWLRLQARKDRRPGRQQPSRVPRPPTQRS